MKADIGIAVLLYFYLKIKVILELTPIPLLSAEVTFQTYRVDEISCAWSGVTLFEFSASPVNLMLLNCRNVKVLIAVLYN